MKQNIELGLPREFGDIISDSFIILRQNFVPLLKSYFAICGVFLVAGIVSNIMFQTQHNFEGERPTIFSLLGMLTMVFSLVNYTALTVTAISYLVLYKEKGNQAPEVMEVWGYFKYYFLRAIGTNVLICIAFGIGTIFCFVPAIYLFPILSLVAPIMVIENANAEYSIRRAFKIIRDNWWFTLGIILLLTVLVLFTMVILIVVPGILISGGVQWLSGINVSLPFAIAQSVMAHLCETLWLLPVIALTLTYYSLTEQKEANTLLSRIKTFGKTDPGKDQFANEDY